MLKNISPVIYCQVSLHIQEFVYTLKENENDGLKYKISKYLHLQLNDFIILFFILAIIGLRN